MRKILIFGNSGSGKSTLAKELCDLEGVAHLDLDTLAWGVSAPPERKPLNESIKAIQIFIASNDGWVIEGCYADLLEQVLPFSSEIIFMNLPIETCIDNAKKRPWEPHKYESKAAQDANLDMLIDWISQYNQRLDTFSEASHRSLYDAFHGKKTIYASNEETPNKHSSTALPDMSITGGCDCNNIGVVWHVVDCSLVPRACQCEYCFAKSAAYVTKSGTKFEVLIRNKKLHKEVQHGSNSAVFHECSHCRQVIFVTSKIEGELYGALNANHLNNKLGFSEPVSANFSSQTAEQKKERWKQNWCHPVTITNVLI